MQFSISRYQFDWDLARHYGLQIGGLAVILVVTWALAKLAKWAFAKLVDRVPLLQRDTNAGESVGASLGKIASLLIWLLGMIAILQQLGLDRVIKPLQTLLDQIMAFIPNIVGAAVILFVGAVVARIVRQLIETSLSAANFDSWAEKGGLAKITGSNTISRTIATVAYVLIILPVAIAALQTLGISAISDPATQLLETLLGAIPLVIGAAILLGIAFFIARWVGELIEDILPNLGLDRALQDMKVLPESVSATKIVSRVSMTAILLFFAIAATRMLNFPELSAILNRLLVTGGQIIFGAAIIGAGTMLANLLANLFKDSVGSKSITPTVVRYATIGLFVAIGLAQMGIGGPIVELAFGAIVISAAVACAIAFGLGGRDAAAGLLARGIADAKADNGD